MRDVVAQHKGGYEVIDVASFSSMRPVVKGVEAALLTEFVEGEEVGVHVVGVVNVGRVVGGLPLLGLLRWRGQCGW